MYCRVHSLHCLKSVVGDIEVGILLLCSFITRDGIDVFHFVSCINHQIVISFGVM